MRRGVGSIKLEYYGSIQMLRSRFEYSRCVCYADIGRGKQDVVVDGDGHSGAHERGVAAEGVIAPTTTPLYILLLVSEIAIS